MSGKEMIVFGILFLSTLIWGYQGWRNYRNNLDDYWSMRDDLTKANHKLIWWNKYAGADCFNFGCEMACGIAYPYGFVPEDGCPVHDKYPVDIEIIEEEE